MTNLTADVSASPSWRDYLALCKPRVVALIVFTALIGMLMASPTLVPIDRLLIANLGIALAAASAAAINHVAEHRIDALMARTKNRPLPQGELNIRQAFIFALALGLLSMCLLVAFINVLTAVLTFLSLIGYAVIYTVFGWSPMPILTRLAPMEVRHVIKAWLWGTEKKDTFPTRFRMNTRSSLRRLFHGVGMKEAAFARLDDCRTFARFRVASELELRLRAACRMAGMPYPEHCIVGIYQKP
jgi:hypothetical protein